MGRSEIRYILIPGGAAIFLSLLVHALFLIFCLASDPIVLRNNPEKELVVDLVEDDHIQDKAHKKTDQKTVDSTLRPPAGSLQQGADPGTDRPSPEKAQRVRLTEPVVDARVQKILKQVEKKIIPIWRQASPPGLGWVRLRMKVLKSGQVTPRSITGLQGPPELGTYVLDMIKEIRFSTVSDVNNLQTPLIIECYFDVTGKSAEN